MAAGSYRLSVMSLEGGEVESSARLNMMTQMAVAEAIDTFVVVGDFGLPDRPLAPETIEFIRAASAGARRTASVCMGVFLLAATGLLDGREPPRTRTLLRGCRPCIRPFASTATAYFSARRRLAELRRG